MKKSLLSFFRIKKHAIMPLIGFMTFIAVAIILANVIVMEKISETKPVLAKIQNKH